MQQTADDLFPEVPEAEPQVQLGDVTELTLRDGSGNSEDKRYQYN